MKVTQEKLSDSQIGLEIEISAEATKNTYEKVVKDLSRSVRIPGFRQGKVPRQVLLQRLGAERVKATALEEIIQESVKQALEEQEIKPLGNYEIRSNFDELLNTYKPGEVLTFSVGMDVPPEAKVEDYHNLVIKAEEGAYDPNWVEQELKEKQEEEAELVPIEDRPAQMGDIVIIDFVGREPAKEGETEGKILPGVTGESFKVELEIGKLIEGLVEGIAGMSLQEKKEIEAIFPEDYPNKELAGKKAIFTVTLQEIKSKELPELDDEFAKEVSEFETIAELRADVEKNFQKQAAAKTKQNIQEAIIAELIKRNDIAIPKTMIDDEINKILAQSAMKFEKMGLDPNQLFNAKNLPQLRANTHPEALANLQQKFILQAIAEQENLKVEEEKIIAKIEELTGILKKEEYDLELLRKYVEELLLEETTLEWLAEKATIELVAENSEKAEPTNESLEIDAIEVEATPSEIVDEEKSQASETESTEIEANQ